MHIDGQMQTVFVIYPVLYAIAMGQIIITVVVLNSVLMMLSYRQ